MLRFLHTLSGILFYVLGATFFLAYLTFRNDIVPMWSAWWMQVADLPFGLVALLYGGLSLYLSVHGTNGKSKVLPWIIGVPLVLLFAGLLVFNFWQKASVL
ncbi:hypothetical protein A3D88_01280 [Candidatus Peribacteria bacterium RIFCSPHIGHO2_02_FULL_52_16]|nr:MAG: hypothetical protein A2706_03520 [Candidatus Peribacteria bacterium RIFCSPHIGHO2_01_FULL_51_35]OGJ60954.1 MAG: hypothetical protein A3D88_01280 [Candidatus Peribacteria bacterium RIFCSPHIGHO2_02_FULL_52_16]